MKPKTYIETTIVSYLTSRPSRDLIVAAHQQITRDWWDTRRDDFDLYVSPLVLDKAKAGDSEFAARRMDVLARIALLEPTDEADRLAVAILLRLALPQKAAADALHISLATVHEMDYLLTWNCAHLANANLRKGIEATCSGMGYKAPIICTPDELLAR
jgi:hypothetical protein